MENLTLVGTVIAVISIIYNILTKLKNTKLTKDLLELEDLFTDNRIKKENLELLLSEECAKNVALNYDFNNLNDLMNGYKHKILELNVKNRTLNEALDKTGRVELVVEDKTIKKSRTKKSK